MIPKRIFSVWLQDHPGPPPLTVRRCIESQRLPGYEHRVIDMAEAVRMVSTGGYPYLEQCLTSPHINKRYCKAADLIREVILFEGGGIYLDADVEVLPGRNFDHLLSDRMFVGRELNGWLGSAVIGAEAGHPFLRGWIDEVLARFRGDDDKNFESSMEILTYRYNQECADLSLGMRIYPRDFFFPYCHQTETIELTDNSICYHHFMKSWVGPSTVAKPEEPSALPTVSILIPQLGRPDGLKRVLASIDALDYPKRLIETLIDDREEPTVPQKVAAMTENSTGDYLVFASNDIEFAPDSVRLAVSASLRTGRGLVSFNTGELTEDRGNANEHFVIRRDLIPRVGGTIFDLDFWHCGVDNLLLARAEKIGEATRCPTALVTHFHFSRGSDIDPVYQRGWSHVDEDRALLQRKLAEL